MLVPRWVYISGGCALGLLALLLSIQAWFPDTTASFIAVMVLYWSKTTIVVGGSGLIGGCIGLGLASTREILDQVGHLKKMFQSYVLVNRQRLKAANFFDDSNGQKYCCEGVVGSDEQFKKILDTCFLAVFLVAVCYVLGFAAIIISLRVLSSVLDWTFCLLIPGILGSLGRVLHPIYKFHFQEDLKVEVPRLGLVATEILKLEDPDYRLPQLAPKVAPNQHMGRRAQRRQANQPQVAPVQVVEETPEEHAIRKKALLVNYQQEKKTILASYPTLSEPEPAYTNNMWFIGVALTIWLCFWAWIALIILQRGFGILAPALPKPANNTNGTANNSTNSYLSTANTSWNWTHWNSTDYQFGLTDYRPLFLGLTSVVV